MAMPCVAPPPTPPIPDVYSCALSLLHACPQFNEVLTATRERLVASLAAQPASMAELRRSLGL